MTQENQFASNSASNQSNATSNADREDQDELQNTEEANPLNIENLKQKMRTQGQAAAAEILAQASKAIANQYRSLAESETQDNELAKSRSMSRKMSIVDRNSKTLIDQKSM